MQDRSASILPWRLLRWLLRLAAVASIALVANSLASDFHGDSIAAIAWQRSRYGMLLFPVATHLGMVLAFWRERLGGAVTWLALLGFFACWYGMHGEWPEQWAGFVLLAAPGLLFLVLGLLDRDGSS